jgi:uncharacterized protein YqgC (DUF456 family)
MSEYGLILWLVGGLLALAGLAGLVVPVLPGAPLLFMGLFCAAWAEDFLYVGSWVLVLLAVLAALTYLVEFVASLVGAKRFGASRLALTGAAVGGLVGIFFGLAGIVSGPFIGAVLGELVQLKSLGKAGMVGIGTVIGLAVGVAGKLVIGMIMLGVFLLVRFL